MPAREPVPVPAGTARGVTSCHATRPSHALGTRAAECAGKIARVPTFSPVFRRPSIRRPLRLSRPLVTAVLAACVLAGLASSPVDAAPARKAAPAAAAPTPPVMRLGDLVTPLAYEAELTVVPTRDRFSGRIVVHAQVAKPTEFFWMNAKRLDIRTATVTAGGKNLAATVVPGGTDFVGLKFASVVPAGRIVIAIEYDGTIDRIDTAGIFRQPDGDNWYAFTQFESTDARRAFPSFDEPGWKVPWHLSLVVPASDTAVSNMPVASEEPYTEPVPAPVREPVRHGGKAVAKAAPAPVAAAPAIPMKRVRFAPTPPLPSYLVAFAVGPFDVVDGGKAGRKGTQLRYIVPKGRAAETQYAKETMPRLLEILEDYFGMPYPYAKLDSVALPSTIGFGAMENAGMITYDLPLLLSRPDQENERFHRYMAGTAAHELAHQWFGDFVTLAWWDDVWLNESFATWMGSKVIERFAPSWQTKLSGDDRRFNAIEIDRLSTTRQIRQPVNTPDDLGSAFDRISYEKGATVLAMFENAIGEERFRNGVRRYIDEHAQGTAKAEDFFNAVASAAGSDGPSLIAGLKSFVQQPGVPRLAVALDCGADGNAPPSLVVTQSRFLPARPATDGALAQRWTIPACFQFGRGGDFNEMCALIKEPRTVLPLPSGERCPQWVLPNRGGSAYAVSSLTPELTQQLVRTPLLPSEAVPALHDATTLTQSGEWPADLALELAAKFGSNRSNIVADAALELAKSVKPSWLDDASDRAAFARYVQKNFGARAKMLGWQPRPSDREGDANQRARLVPWVADLGNDADLRKEAQRLAREWLGSKAPFPTSARTVLTAAAMFAQGSSGRELLDAMNEALGRVSTRDRHDVLKAMGAFRDPALAQASYDLLFALPDPKAGFEAMQEGADEDEIAATLALAYLKSHYDTVTRRLPDYGIAWLPRLGRAMCDAGTRSDFEAVFADRSSKAPGAGRNYAQSLETMNICIGARQTQRATLKAWLAKQ